MMRNVVGSLTGVIIVLILMYFTIPQLYTTHQNFGLLVNSSDSVITQSYIFGSGMYTALPFIPIVGFVFVIISYALKRED